MKFSNFTNSLLTNFIPQKNSKLAKFLAWNSCSESHISLNTWWISANKGSKFKLDYVEPKNNDILLIDTTNFELRLINFLYIFWGTRYCIYKS